MATKCRISISDWKCLLKPILNIMPLLFVAVILCSCANSDHTLLKKFRAAGPLSREEVQALKSWIQSDKFTYHGKNLQSIIQAFGDKHYYWSGGEIYYMLATYESGEDERTDVTLIIHMDNLQFRDGVIVHSGTRFSHELYKPNSGKATEFEFKETTIRTKNGRMQDF